MTQNGDVHKKTGQNWSNSKVGNIKGASGTTTTISPKEHRMSGADIVDGIEKNGWRADNSNPPVFIRNGRIITLEGGIYWNGGNVGNNNHGGQPIFTIPSAGTRPNRDLVFPIATGETNTELTTLGFLFVRRNGTIALSKGVHRYVSLSGVTWTARADQ